jgi:hypothetical protein
MADYKKYISISENEEILKEIEGDAYNQDSNPIARMIGTIIRVVSIMLGMRMKTHIIITSTRVIRLDFQKMFWIFNKGVKAMSITPRSIGSVGYSNERVFLIFKSRYFILNTSTEQVYIKFQGNDSMLLDTVNQVSNMLESVKTK